MQEGNGEVHYTGPGIYKKQTLFDAYCKYQEERHILSYLLLGKLCIHYKDSGLKNVAYTFTSLNISFCRVAKCPFVGVF